MIDEALTKARHAKSNIEKKSTPLVARTLRTAMRLPLPAAVKRSLWFIANRNFLHTDASITCSDILGNRVICGTNDNIQKHIAIFGMWEPNLTSYLLSKKKPGGIFLDIGANIGYFSLLASRIFDRVIAFEPSSRAFDILSRNIQMNGCNNVTAIQCAVTEQRGKLPLFEGASIIEGFIKSTTNAFEIVNCAPLQDYLSESDWRAVRFVKIDVEGSELSVLNSLLKSRHLLNENIELSIESNCNEDATAVFNTLSEIGFSVFDFCSTYSLDHYLARAAQEPIPIMAVPDTLTDCLYRLKH
jgi:FkbM family methyltransferase